MSIGELHARTGVAGCGRLLLAVLLAFGWLVALAMPASAHASLVETVPADGAATEPAPEAVVLRFSEDVAPPPDGVRVYDGDANRVDAA